MSAALRLVLVFPGDLATRTGGYIYDRRAAHELERRGWRIERVSLPASFPFPSSADLVATAQRLALVPDGSTVLVDGLALGAMPDLAAAMASRVDLVALVHHPLCLEEGLDPTAMSSLAASEGKALASARAAIVTSDRTAASLVELLGVPKSRITVALPGTDPAPRAHGSGGDMVRMLCVGAVIPRKAHGLLVRALAGVAGPWQLELAGSVERDPFCTAALRNAIEATGLTPRIRLLGELEEAELAAAYGRADVLVSASLYEGYGMAITEALARGLPVIAAAGGAVSDTLPEPASLLVPPGDVSALRGALQQFLSEGGLGERLRRGAVSARATLPRWADTAAVLERVLLKRPP